MPKLNATKLPIARATAKFLALSCNENKYLHVGIIAGAINVAAGLKSDDALNGTAVKAAFGGDDASAQYIINYNDKELSLGDIDGIGKSDFISVIREARVNGGRVCIIGRFNSKKAEKEALDNGYKDAVGNAVEVQRFARSCPFTLDDDTKVELVEQQQRLQRSKKRKSLASSSKLRNTKKRKADEQQGREQEQQKEQQHDDVIRLAGEKCSLLQAQFNTAIEVANTIKKNLDLATAEYYAVTNNAPSTRTSIPQDDTSATNATPTNNSTTTTSVTADEEVDSKDAATDDGILYFSIGQYTGRIQLDEDGEKMLPLNDLQQYAQQIGTKMGGYTIQQFGQKKVWVPNRAVLIGKDYLTKLENKSKQIKKLYDFFQDSRTTLPQNSRNVLAACDLLAYGCGDEAKFIQKVGAFKAILLAMGINDISNKAISQAVPKRDTISNDELYLAALSRAIRRQEMRDDHVEYLGGQSDHGKRRGVDHLVFPVSWVANGEFGLKLKTHVIGTNHTGGTILQEKLR